MSDDSLVHCDVSGAVVLFSNCGSSALDVLLGLADGTVGINGPSDLGANVGICHAFGAGCEDAGFVERVHPEFPVLAAHNVYSVCYVVTFSRLDSHFGNEILIGI